MRPRPLASFHWALSAGRLAKKNVIGAIRGHITNCHSHALRDTYSGRGGRVLSSMPIITTSGTMQMAMSKPGRFSHIVGSMMPVLPRLIQPWRWMTFSGCQPGPGTGYRCVHQWGMGAPKLPVSFAGMNTPSVMRYHCAIHMACTLVTAPERRNLRLRPSGESLLRAARNAYGMSLAPQAWRTLWA